MMPGTIKAIIHCIQDISIFSMLFANATVRMFGAQAVINNADVAILIA